MADNQTIIDLLRRANSQLDAQNNEPGGADRPTPGLPSSALEPAVKGTLGAVGDVVGGIMGLPKQFMEASARDVYNLGDHTQPKESVGPAAEIAMNLAGFGAPAAERGAAGIFGGKLAKTADMAALERAQNMEMKGMDPLTMYQDTGWFKHPLDQQWRFEIPDHASKVSYFDPKTKTTANSDFMFSHPALYDAYPSLAKRNVTLSHSDAPEGGFWPEYKSIEASGPDRKALRGVMSHELQHAVQDIEGFTPGSSQEMFARLLEQAARQEKKPYSYTDISDKSYQAYRKTAGEVEARNSDFRKDFTPDERRTQPPWQTQQHPYEEQLYINPLTGNPEANNLLDSYIKVLRQK